MNYNLSSEDKKKVKTQFSAWLELQDEKKEIAEAEKSAKEAVKDIMECTIGQAGKLFSLMQKKYNAKLSDEEDIWAAMNSISSPDSEDEKTEEED
jgi:hypothetical protein